MSALRTRHAELRPAAAGVSRMSIEDTVVGEPHLTETEPVAPAGDQ
ncbi:hypothetical protein SGLAM104S_08037 [Streptomyces glaucescens]